MDTVQRRELKFILSRSDSCALQQEFRHLLYPDTYAGDKGYQVRSLYFDSLNQTDYVDKVNGEEFRKKIRLRIYDLHQTDAKFEYKQKFGAYQNKTSLTVSKSDVQQYINGDYHSLLHYPEDFAKQLYSVLTLGAYLPSAVIAYQRRAYTFPVYNTRITFDSDIKRCESCYNLYSDTIPFYPVLSEKVILEIKYNGVLIDAIRRILAKYYLVNTSFGKYVSGRLIG